MVMLYIILHIFMEKPFSVYINNLREAIGKKDQSVLNAAGVDTRDYARVDGLINNLKGVKWLALEKADNISNDKTDKEFTSSIQKFWAEIKDDIYQKQNHQSS